MFNTATAEHTAKIYRRTLLVLVAGVGSINLLLSTANASALPAESQDQNRSFHVASPCTETGTQHSGNRQALVIGNAEYIHIASLRNTANDAQAIADLLRDIDFKVMLCLNASLTEMKKQIRRFHDQLEANSVGLFYCAGHAVAKDGSNFLIPVGADINGEYEIEDESVSLKRVLGALGDKPDRLKIVILDACRNNPYPWSRSPQVGLTAPNAPLGTLIAYAAAPEQEAYDGIGVHGLFTGELLKAFRVPGQTIETILKRTRQAVVNAAADPRVPLQVPWVSSSLIGEFIPIQTRGDTQKFDTHPQKDRIDLRSLWESTTQQQADSQAPEDRARDKVVYVDLYLPKMILVNLKKTGDIFSGLVFYRHGPRLRNRSTLSGATVTLSRSGLSNASGRSDINGIFRINTKSTGDFRLTVQHSSYQPITTRIRLGVDTVSVIQ